jgi:hypothetical protein
MLDRLLGRLDAGDKIIFWFFWVPFVVMLISGKIGRHFYPTPHPPYSSGLLLGSIVVLVVAGRLVWKVLCIERFSTLKNIVVGMQGLVLLPFILIVPGALIEMGVKALLRLLNLHPDTAAAVSGIPSGLCLMIGLFLGGCFFGLRFRRLIFIWGIAIAVLIYAITDTFPSILQGFFLAGMLGSFMLGCYLGNRYLLDKDGGKAPVENAVA